MKTEPCGTALLNARKFEWRVWNGEQLSGCIAVDTETTLIEHASKIPDICLVSVSDGTQHFVVATERLAEFLAIHEDKSMHFVFHNVRFDFAVIDQYLDRIGESDVRNVLWSAVDDHRVHDTMLLAVLISLANEDCDIARSLADLCKAYLGLNLDKEGYRCHFSEIQGKDWSEVDTGFFKYAVKDAIATWHLFSVLTHEANNLCNEHGTPDQYGFLSESLQVKGAISLDFITRNGMTIDRERVAVLQEELTGQISCLVDDIQVLAPDAWQLVTKTGQMAINPDSGLPKVNQKAIRARLQEIANLSGVEIPRTAKGELSLSTKKVWSQHRKLDPLVDLYCEYQEKSKYRTFFAGLNQERIHPRYQTVKRTGRTSCSSPNIQQLPAGTSIREAVVASAGSVLFIIDYSCLELRTLASECYRLLGQSRLREVLIEGRDPHSYTAAMFAGMSPDDFETHSDRKQLRQHAKVFNFGIPGGFSSRSLVDYASSTYGVDLTVDEAEHFIAKLTKDVYPELGLYLDSEPHSILAAKLGCSAVEIAATWNEPFHLPMLRKILQGSPFKADGTPYQSGTVDGVWLQLRSLCRNSDLLPFIEQRDISEQSPLRHLLSQPVSTATGRIRANLEFTQSKNTPFQGLAADGCKQAMWNLTKAGYRLIGFVHDEFIVEIPEADHYTDVASDINEICRRSMEEFVPGIPVTCEYAVSRRWSKQAEAAYDSSGRLISWQCN
ncbi:MAG: DNA polymerase [Pirellulales bacterium]